MLDAGGYVVPKRRELESCWHLGSLGMCSEERLERVCSMVGKDVGV